MNALAFLKRPSPVALDRAIAADLERQLKAIEFPDCDQPSAPMITPLELAEHRLNNFIVDEEAAITVLQRKIAERESFNQADRDEIAQRKAAIALYRGDQPKSKPTKGKAAQ